MAESRLALEPENMAKMDAYWDAAKALERTEAEKG